MTRIAPALLAGGRTHWRPLAAGLATLLLLAAGLAGGRAWQRQRLIRRVQATEAAQAAHQAQADALHRRTDSTAAYEAGRLTELHRQATLLAHADETLTAQRPAAVCLPARPPRE